jgi:hypothetical protein
MSGTPLLRAAGLVLVLHTAKGMFKTIAIFWILIFFVTGRGVFAAQPIIAGTVIEVCPVLIFSDDEMANHISKTSIDHYT